MTSLQRGTNTSDVEITNVDSHGLWILVNSAEYFLPYSEYPWFKEAKIADILDVSLLHGEHLRWENLDVDLHVKALGNPEAYPLMYN